MTQTEECLSIMELLELRASGGTVPSGAQRHVDRCPRCAGLLRALPGLIAEETPPETLDLRARPVTTDKTVRDVHAGQVWLIRAPAAPGQLFVAVVLGRRRDAAEAVVVAPTSDEIQHATDLDVLIDDSVLGYAFMVSTWNFGTVLTEQLQECLGTLPESDQSVVRSVYSLVVTGESPTLPVTTGVGTAGPEDERLLWRSEQLAAVLPLWGPWRQQQTDQESELLTGEMTRDTVELSLSVLIHEALDEGEWDIVSLAEAAHVATTHIQAILEDRLDLTDQTDVDAVAAAIHAIRRDFDQIEPYLRRSLECSSGGLRIGLAGTDRIAARTRAEVGEDQRRRRLWEGLASVDESDVARRRAIESYVQAVETRLEELGRH